ncbi:hypothetical protein TNCV_3549641 [Trichonephila clavipes]|nr:hypothetical protein TNCV_3549641 [Trichonephila clavipes]
MSVPDYALCAEDHRTVLVLVKQIEKLMDIKSVMTQTPVGGVWRGDTSSGVVFVSQPWFKIMMSVSNSPHVAL